MKEIRFQHNTNAGLVTVSVNGCTLSGRNFLEPLKPLDALYLLARHGNLSSRKLNILSSLLHSQDARKASRFQKGVTVC